MREAVSDILATRSQAADGLTRMVILSFAAHVVFVAVVTLLPSNWINPSRESETASMFISLGGAPGPDSGGMTQMSARPVQQVAPEVKQPFVQAPAAKKPEMTIPEASAKPLPRASRVEKPVESSTSRKAATGAEITSGASRVNTGGAPIPFGGLAQGGGGGQGLTALNVENFCCPEYLQTMLQLIRKNWDQNQGVAGRVVVRYTIRRDGVLTNVEVVKPSGSDVLDLASRRAVLMTARLPPLPPQYTEPNLTINLTFEYQR